MSMAGVLSALSGGGALRGAVGGVWRPPPIVCDQPRTCFLNSRAPRTAAVGTAIFKRIFKINASPRGAPGGSRPVYCRIIGLVLAARLLSCSLFCPTQRDRIRRRRTSCRLRNSRICRRRLPRERWLRTIERTLYMCAAWRHYWPTWCKTARSRGGCTHSTNAQTTAQLAPWVATCAPTCIARIFSSGTRWLALTECCAPLW